MRVLNNTNPLRHIVEGVVDRDARNNGFRHSAYSCFYESRVGNAGLVTIRRCWPIVVG